MRVLLAYPYLPSPDAHHGSARLVSRLLADLRGDAEITLLCNFRPGKEDHLLESVKPLCAEVVCIPRPFAEDLGPLARIGEAFHTAGTRRRTDYPVPVVKLYRDAYREAFRKLLASKEFDVLQVECSVLGPVIDLWPNDRRSILVDHEAGGDGEDWQRYVQDVYTRFQSIVVLSEEDRQQLAPQLPGRNIEVRPPGVEIPPDVNWDPEIGRVLFFGSPGHLPNRDALRFLSLEIVPRMRALSRDVKVVCAGFASSDGTEARMAAKTGIELLGRVPDINAEIRRAAVVLSPVRLGRGVRIKNLETLAQGTPLVTTSLGAQGLRPFAGEGFILADGADALAEAAVRVATDPGQHAALAKRGHELAREHFPFSRQADLARTLWSSR